MLTENQKKQVKDILLMPIECTTIECTRQETLNVFLYNDRIFSSQKYKGFDPDMSDFAVEFYQIIYKGKLEKLENEILDKNGQLKILSKYKEFCGDTMNSYKTISKLLSDNEIKKELKDKYHSLANFWLLPMDVGHSSSWTRRRGLGEYSKSKNGFDDYMDRFLQNYLDKYEQYKEIYPEYARQFTKDNIGADHFLEGIYIENKEVINFTDFKTNGITADDIARIMCDKIKDRAACITNKKGAELYKFFYEKGLIDTLINSYYQDNCGKLSDER